jgi:hypothetical protein
MTRLVAAVLGGLLVTMGSAAHARLPKLVEGVPETPSATTPLEKASGEVPPAAHVGGEKYVGVVPGGDVKNPLPPAKKTPPRLIWSGFKSGAAGSEVFFQTNQPVTYDVVPSKTGDGKELSVFLRNCRIHMRNNGRNLDTRFFATPVQGVTARQRRKDVELRIALKEPTTPTPRTEPGPDGSQFLVLDFPPGQPAAVEARPAPASTPAP